MPEVVKGSFALCICIPYKTPGSARPVPVLCRSRRVRGALGRAAQLWPEIFAGHVHPGFSRRPSSWCRAGVASFGRRPADSLFLPSGWDRTHSGGVGDPLLAVLTLTTSRSHMAAALAGGQIHKDPVTRLGTAE